MPSVANGLLTHGNAWEERALPCRECLNDVCYTYVVDPFVRMGNLMWSGMVTNAYEDSSGDGNVAPVDRRRGDSGYGNRS